MDLRKLYVILEKRIKASPKESYTVSLFEQGIDRIAQKVGEEGVEVVIASKNDNKQLLIGEISDLYYHLLVLMIAKGITLDDINSELAKRHAEKTIERD